MRVGRFEIEILPDAPFRLDGGAMFGVVPKALWERRKAADERNRIQMITNCLLVRSPEALLLVDTGIGEKLDERSREIFAVDEDGPNFLRALDGAGVAPEDVDHVLLTHLHFDHCGWSTRREGDEWVPGFPQATYWVERRELNHARRPNERDRPSYDRRNFEPLAEAGVLETFDEAVEPVPGVRLEHAPGHTPGMCVATILDGDEGAVFLADLVPTAAHLPVPWVMGFDLEPVVTMQRKKEWLRRIAQAGWLCIFEHDPELPIGLLVEERPGRYAAEEPRDTRPREIQSGRVNAD